MQRCTFLTAVLAGSVTAVLVTLVQPTAHAHCEIPCGIYGDHARIDQMLEDTTTITKAMQQINQLAGRHDPQAAQQAIRWTVNKEDHATRIQHTIAQYFMTQRIKPVDSGNASYQEYLTRLAQHHDVMVAAMKAKQTVDPRVAAQLRAAIEVIAPYYPPAGATTKPAGR